MFQRFGQSSADITNLDSVVLTHFHADHSADPPSAGKVARDLHRTPERIGTIGSEAGVRLLVLSHLIKLSFDRLDKSKAVISDAYAGPTVVAADLLRIELERASDR